MNPFCAHPFALAYLVRFAQTGPGDGCIVRFSPPNGSAVCTHTDTHKHMHVHSRTANPMSVPAGLPFPTEAPQKLGTCYFYFIFNNNRKQKALPLGFRPSHRFRYFRHPSPRRQWRKQWEMGTHPKKRRDEKHKGHEQSHTSTQNPKMVQLCCGLIEHTF